MKYQALDEHLRLNGTWIQLHLNEDGVDYPTEGPSAGSTAEFNNGNFTVRSAEGDCLLEGTYRIDPAPDPAEIDWTDSSGDDAGKLFRAIYRLTETTFTFCAADEGLARPKAFEPQKGYTIRRFARHEA